MNQLILDLKAAGEDHEFYPTTHEIIGAVLRDMRGLKHCRDFANYSGPGSFLDIGAGNGKVLEAVAADDMLSCSLYAIEKSQILCRELSPVAFVVGTDLLQQSLITKTQDITFCNPPYSQFESWAEKIIRESGSKIIYLVIPQRWAHSERIQGAIEFRGAIHKVLGDYSFANAEDRQARAVVDLVRIDLFPKQDKTGHKSAFDLFFDQTFADLTDRFANFREESDGNSRKAKFDELTVGADFLSRLVNMYELEIVNIKENYAAVGTLDPALLNELDISICSIKECLFQRLANLKNSYWQELFSHMRIITDRLTDKKRSEMLKRLNESGIVDFTVDNIKMIVGWVLENANQYIDEQLLETYGKMISKANVKNYKSNKKVFEWDRWRYSDKNTATHFALEYRIVIAGYLGLHQPWTGDRYEMHESGLSFLRDMLTVSRNLGFACNTQDPRLLQYHSGHQWTSGTKELFYYLDSKGRRKELLEVKAFKNGNLHIRMSQDLALALNVEYGRLKGWIHTSQEAGEELQDKKAAAFFGAQLRLTDSSVKMLTA